MILPFKDCPLQHKVVNLLKTLGDFVAFGFEVTQLYIVGGTFIKGQNTLKTSRKKCNSTNTFILEL